jgi:hypothetical protein
MRGSRAAEEAEGGAHFEETQNQNRLKIKLSRFLATHAPIVGSKWGKGILINIVRL